MNYSEKILQLYANKISRDIKDPKKSAKAIHTFCKNIVLSNKTPKAAFTAAMAEAKGSKK